MNKIMTLEQWCIENDTIAWHHAGRDMFYVPDKEYKGNRSKLWQLEDYRVWSVMAGTIWLSKLNEQMNQSITD